MIMKATRASAVVVVSQSDGTVSGIVTERDLLRRVLAPSSTATDASADAGVLGSPEALPVPASHTLPSAASIRVGEVMTQNPRCVPRGTSCLEALQIMCKGRFRHLPVVSTDKSPAGMLDSLVLAGTIVANSKVHPTTTNTCTNTNKPRLLVCRMLHAAVWSRSRHVRSSHPRSPNGVVRWWSCRRRTAWIGCSSTSASPCVCSPLGQTSPTLLFDMVAVPPCARCLKPPVSALPLR